MTETAPVYRLKAPKAKEHARQDQIIDYLRALQARGRVVWIARINSGGKLIREGGGRRFIRFYQSWLPGALPASKGVADILVMLPGGRLMALEVKQPGEKPTPEQRRFLAAVEAGGGLAAVVYGWEDVRTLLEPAHG